MPRPYNTDFIKPWKICLPATLAGRVEFMLSDPLTHKPIYGARNKLIASLLEHWLARETNRPPTPVPTLSELRD